MSRRSLWAVALLAGLAPRPVTAGVEEGRRLLRGGDVARAADEFARALESNPQDADAATRLGQALAKLGRRSEAEAAYRRAIVVAPSRAAAYAALGELWVEDPARWRRRDEIAAFLLRGLGLVPADDARRLTLVVSLANFERSVGRIGDARRRLEAVDLAAIPVERRRRVLDRLESVRAEQRALELRDWPDAAATDEARRALDDAERRLARGETRSARDAASALIEAHAGWRGPLWLRARAEEALGHHDEAQRDLTILLQLQPSHAEGWRLLGRILAVHGGALEAERADTALRRALALEPAWWDLWLLRARVAIRRGRSEEAERALQRYRDSAPEQVASAEVARLTAAARGTRGGAARPRSTPVLPPSARALAELREAQEWLDLGDPAGLATALLERALADSPALVEAATTLYSLTGVVPEATVRTLWNDGEALLDLARRVLSLGHDDARSVVRPWIDRAADLEVPAAWLERAVQRVEAGERVNALGDLWRYAASGPTPDRMDEARVLMAALAGEPAQPKGARPLDVAEERDEIASADAPCQAATRAEQLVPLGMAAEWRADLDAALTCYQEALRRDESAKIPLARLAGVAARAPASLLRGLETALQRAAESGIAAAHLALARIESGQAADRIDRYLRLADPDDPEVPMGRALAAQLAGARRGRRQTAWLVALGLAGVAWAALRWLGGAKLGAALGRTPQLFPDVARTIAELRHDVLKHRVSVIGLDAPAEEIARTLWEPRRASQVVADAYEALRQAARARGVRLRRLAREPVFGPLCRDLERAEVLARRGGPRRALAALADRLAALHSDRLTALLRLGPRTRVDAAQVMRWIRDIEAELRARGSAWVSPVLHLHGLDLDFPVDRAALGAIFANLLRNAEAAASCDASPSVLVRLAEERDGTGQRLLLLLVGDSSRQALSLETIEGREAGRGLAIVRDMVREWRGHLVVRSDVAPWQKGVGACFPA